MLHSLYFDICRSPYSFLFIEIKRLISFKTFSTTEQLLALDQGCQIFLGPNIPNWGKIYQIITNLYPTAINYTIWP
jgi:hypothetical protein